MWNTAIESFGMPCILVFDKYYFSIGSIEVLTERERKVPSMLFIGCLYYEDGNGSFGR